MLTHPLLPKLRALQLSGMLLTLDTRAAQAAQSNLTPTEFLAILLDDELERRDQQRLKRRVSEAGVDPAKTLAQFDFAAVPALNRTLVLDLATCGFVSRAENVLVCGPTGTGKSHLANALAVEALYDRPRELASDAEGTQMRKLRAEMHQRRLGNGYCARPVDMDCHFESICESCTFFVTTAQFRPTLQRQRDDAAAKGQIGRQRIFDGLLIRLDEDAS